MPKTITELIAELQVLRAVYGDQEIVMFPGIITEPEYTVPTAVYSEDSNKVYIDVHEGE